jgi:hypothetical protein
MISEINDCESGFPLKAVSNALFVQIVLNLWYMPYSNGIPNFLYRQLIGPYSLLVLLIQEHSLQFFFVILPFHTTFILMDVREDSKI